MQGMTMWIVLGALIAAVIVFLIVASVRDRRKNKKIKIEKEQMAKRKSSAGKNVAEDLLRIFNKIQKMLKDFVPSVGQIKMADIRGEARKELKALETSTKYKDLSERENNIKAIFKKFKTTSPNTWAKKLTKEIKELKTFIEEWKKEQANKAKESKKKKGKNAKKANK